MQSRGDDLQRHTDLQRHVDPQRHMDEKIAFMEKRAAEMGLTRPYPWEEPRYRVQTTKCRNCDRGAVDVIQCVQCKHWTCGICFDAWYEDPATMIMLDRGATNANNDFVCLACCRDGGGSDGSSSKHNRQRSL